MSGTGLQGSFGIAAESVFGTYVAPSRFHPPKDSAKPQRNVNVVQGGGLDGQLVQSGSKREITHESGTLSANLEVTRTGMGLLIAHIMGGTITPAQIAATTAYKLTAPLADNAGKSLTAQVGVPKAGTSTVVPYTARGCKVTSAEFSCGVGEFLMLALEMDAQRISRVESLANASYPSRRAFHFRHLQVLVGDYGSEELITGVKKVSFKLERPQDTERFYAGADGFKAEQLGNDRVNPSVSLDFDFVDEIFADMHSSQEPASMILRWQADEIEDDNFSQLDIVLPQVFAEDGAPGLDGPGIVTNSVPLVAKYDGTHAAATIEYTLSLIHI